MFRWAVETSPDVTAVMDGDRAITYREFGRAVNGLSSRLDEYGIQGKRVVLIMANSIEMDVALMAVMASGAQVAPANPFFTVPELERALGAIGPLVILSDARSTGKARTVAPHLGVDHCLAFERGGLELGDWTGLAALDRKPLQLPSAADPALVIFTGGSTGIPKGVDHTHGSIMALLLQHRDVWPFDDEREVFLNPAPMFHIWGLTFGTWVPVYCRSPLVLMPRFEAEPVLRALEARKVTVFAGGPAPIYMRLLAEKCFDEVDLSSLKYCPTGGAPCPEELHREWMARTGMPLLEGWGMSEGAPFCLTPADDRRLLSVGRPVPQTHVEIVDVETGDVVLGIGEVGEVRVRGPQLMRGYIGHGEETAAALRGGWMYTGDIGFIDDDGFVFLVDRKKDMVLVGGYNVYPREVDEILFRHPKIREAATVGKPDPRLGEVVVAFVVPESGETMDEEEFSAYCRRTMVKYKRPVEVHFVEALPRTGANKIDRVALRERAHSASPAPGTLPEAR
jgi:long-chain acyl-CoA synthetase